MKLEISNIKMPMDKKGKNYFMIHLFLVGIVLVIWGMTVSAYWYSGAGGLWAISFGYLVVIGVILVSLADYLDIIELRKSVARHTKCVICGRTNEPAKISRDEETHDDTITKMTKIDKDKKSGSEIITEHQHIPEVKLSGLVINNRVVCIECVKIMKELVK